MSKVTVLRKESQMNGLQCSIGMSPQCSTRLYKEHDTSPQQSLIEIKPFETTINITPIDNFFAFNLVRLRSLCVQYGMPLLVLMACLSLSLATFAGIRHRRHEPVNGPSFCTEIVSEEQFLRVSGKQPGEFYEMAANSTVNVIRCAMPGARCKYTDQLTELTICETVSVRHSLRARLVRIEDDHGQIGKSSSSSQYDLLVDVYLPGGCQCRIVRLPFANATHSDWWHN